MLTLSKVAASGTKMAIDDAAIAAVLGYAVVFVGLIVLMCVIIGVGKIMIAQEAKGKANSAQVNASQPAPAAKGSPAPGSAGEIKLYDTPDRDAAMVMAIVAYKLGKPLNELRFISIKEVKE